MLELTTTKYFEMTDSELNELIEKVYGIDVEVWAFEEKGNHYDAFFVSKAPLDFYEVEELVAWKQDKSYDSWPGIHLVMQDLVNSNQLPEGKYLIDGTW